jgi:outer membrane lipoprotein-sorting protein
MRVFVLGIGCLLAPAVLAQSQPDLTGILSKVSETYANAKQFRFAIKKRGEESGVLQIAVQKPNRFRFEADGSVIDGVDAFSKITMVSDGGTAWNYLAELQQYTQKKSTLPLLDTEPPAISPETFVLQAETLFLTRYSELAKASDHARYLRRETLQAERGSVNCYVIELEAPRPGYRDTYTWWVDPKRYVVLREDTKPATPRRPVSSMVYTMAAIDELIPDEVFRFTPPPSAKQVDQLEP